VYIKRASLYVIDVSNLFWYDLIAMTHNSRQMNKRLLIIPNSLGAFSYVWEKFGLSGRGGVYTKYKKLT